MNFCKKYLYTVYLRFQTIIHHEIIHHEDCFYFCNSTVNILHYLLQNKFYFYVKLVFIPHIGKVIFLTRLRK